MKSNLNRKLCWPGTLTLPTGTQAISGACGLNLGTDTGAPSSNITGEKEAKKACRPADVMDGGTARHGQTVLFKRQPHVVSSSTFVPSGSPLLFFAKQQRQRVVV